MSEEKRVLNREDVPEGYIVGLVRDSYPDNPHVAHLYKGTFNDPGDPMCRHGWNRGIYGYSIWRGVVGYKGICKVCLRRAKQNKKSIPYPAEKNNNNPKI